MGSPIFDPAPTMGSNAAADATLDGLWADLGLNTTPSDGHVPLSTLPAAVEAAIEIDLDGAVPASPAPARAESTRPLTTGSPLGEGYLPADFEFPAVKTPAPTSGAIFAPPPPPPAQAGWTPVPPPVPADNDPRHELEALSRLSGNSLAQELCRIARELEAAGCIPDAVRIWRAAQLLDPLSNDAALALVRLTS